MLSLLQDSCVCIFSFQISTLTPYSRHSSAVRGEGTSCTRAAAEGTGTGSTTFNRAAASPADSPSSLDEDLQKTGLKTCTFVSKVKTIRRTMNNRVLTYKLS